MSDRKIVLGVGDGPPAPIQQKRQQGAGAAESTGTNVAGRRSPGNRRYYGTVAPWSILAVLGATFTLLGAAQILPQWFSLGFSTLEGMAGFARSIALLPLLVSGVGLLATGLIWGNVHKPGRVLAVLTLITTAALLLLSSIFTKLALAGGRSLGSMAGIIVPLLVYVALLGWMGWGLWGLGQMGGNGDE